MLALDQFQGYSLLQCRKNFEETNSKPHKNIDSLKGALQVAWDDLDPEMISASCRHAHKRMEAVVEANGGYIEDK